MNSPSTGSGTAPGYLLGPADVRKLDMVQVLTRPHANLTASVK